MESGTAVDSGVGGGGFIVADFVHPFVDAVVVRPCAVILGDPLTDPKDEKGEGLAVPPPQGDYPSPCLSCRALGLPHSRVPYARLLSSEFGEKLYWVWDISALLQTGLEDAVIPIPHHGAATPQRDTVTYKQIPGHDRW